MRRKITTTVYYISLSGLVKLLPALVVSGAEFKILFLGKLQDPRAQFYLNESKTSYMKPLIIKLNLAGTIVHVNAAQIMYYYAKQEQSGKIATVIYLAKGWGIEVEETPDEIDSMLGAATF